MNACTHLKDSCHFANNCFVVVVVVVVVNRKDMDLGSNSIYKYSFFFVKIRLLFNDISFPQGTYLSSIRRHKCANHWTYKYFKTLK